MEIREDKVKYSKAFVLYGFNVAFTSVIGFLSNLLFTKYFGVKVVGQYTLILSFVSILFSISTFGLLSGVGREATLLVTKNRNMGGLLTITYLVIVLLTLILAIPFGKFVNNLLVSEYQSPELFVPLVFVATVHLLFVIPAALITTSFECHQKLRSPLVMNLISGTFKIILLLLSVHTGRQIISAISINYIIPSSLLFLLLLFSSLRSLKLDFGIINLNETIGHFKNVLNYSLRLLPVTFFELINANLTYLLIGHYLSVEMIGEYRVVFSIFTLIAVIPLIFSKIILPIITRLFFENKLNSIYNYFHIMLKFSLILLIPIVVGASVFSKEILFLYGINSHSAQISLVILLIATLVLSGSSVGSVLSAYNKPEIISLYLGAGAVFHLILSLIVTPRFGIIGASVSSLFGYLLTQYLIFRYAMKLMKKKVNINVLFRPMINGLVMAIVMISMRCFGGDVLFLICVFLIGFITYVIFSMRFNSFSADDFFHINSLVNTIKNQSIKNILTWMLLKINYI